MKFRREGHKGRDENVSPYNTFFLSGIFFQIVNEWTPRPDRVQEKRPGSNSSINEDGRVIPHLEYRMLSCRSREVRTTRSDLYRLWSHLTPTFGLLKQTRKLLNLIPEFLMSIR